jgi:hypothetical protein
MLILGIHGKKIIIAAFLSLTIQFEKKEISDIGTMLQ